MDTKNLRLSGRYIHRRQGAQDKSGLGRSALYYAMEHYGFPRPIKLGERAVGWFDDEIEEWLATRKRTSSGGDSN